MKEFISLQSHFILPRKNSFTGILKGLSLLICNTTFFFLITDTLKTDGTEESLHSTDESYEEENDTFISNLSDYRFLNFCFLRCLLCLWQRFLLFTLIYTVNIFDFAISLEICYSAKLLQFTEAAVQRCSLKIRHSQKFRKIHRKAPVPESLFQ